MGMENNGCIRKIFNRTGRICWVLDVVSKRASHTRWYHLPRESRRGPRLGQGEKTKFQACRVWDAGRTLIVTVGEELLQSSWQDTRQPRLRLFTQLANWQSEKSAPDLPPKSMLSIPMICIMILCLKKAPNTSQAEVQSWLSSSGGLSVFPRRPPFWKARPLGFQSKAVVFLS